MKHPYSFDLSVTPDKETREIMAVYMRIRKGKSVKTKEFEAGAAFADYGIKGELLGIEILQPCSISVLDQMATKDAEAQSFIKRSIPRGMVAAGV